ncbi:hypothetical protein HKX48_007198 [Thoreauomyces humboldtii]|nr:hypothetical protein HKX48_007198 [Thoreauomyces humboldtii]
MQTATFTYKTVKSNKDGQGDHHLLVDVHWSVESASPESDVTHVKTSTSPRPAAIVFHAGGWVVGDKHFIPKATVPHLTSLGFIVVVPNYRLCPTVSVHDGPLEDARDVLAWTRTDLNALLKQNDSIAAVDPTRVVAVGYSAGGTLALMLGGEPDPVTAILDVYGVKDLSDPSWDIPAPGFLLRPKPEEAYALEVFDGPDPVSAMSVAFGQPPVPSPRGAWMNLVSQRGTWLKECVKDGDHGRVDPVVVAGVVKKGSFPPVFCIHGTDDQFVPFHISSGAVEKFRKSGVDVTFLPVQGVNHLFDMTLEDGDKAFKETVGKGFEFLASRV